MLNPDLEIDMLKWKLQDKGYAQDRVSDIVESASQDISIVLLDILTNAISTALEYADTLGATEFANDIDILEAGHSYYIYTKSGKTDYSRQKQEMLPHLLKNAEVSKDGDRYKVIPVRQKTNITVGSSLDDILQQRQDAIKRAKEVAKQSRTKTTSANSLVQGFVSAVDKTVAQKRQERQDIRTGAPVSFRTASSKQNPNTQWVIPAKDMDMTAFLMDLNSRLMLTVEESVIIIMNSYNQEYL